MSCAAQRVGATDERGSNAAAGAEGGEEAGRTARESEPGNDAGNGEEGSRRLGARFIGAAGALQEAGFPPSTVRSSRRGINRMIREELQKLGRKYIRMGKELTPEDEEAMVRGRLVENVILGSDKGVMAAKQLGADKRVAMWQAESTANLIVLQPPPVRQVTHPVPLLPSKHPEDLEAEDNPR